MLSAPDPSQTVLVAGDGADNLGKQAGGWTITWQGTGNEDVRLPRRHVDLAGTLKERSTAGGGTAVLSAEGSYSSEARRRHRRLR